MNALINELKSMYPIQQGGHPTPVVVLDCMDSRRNVSGLGLFMDSRHMVDAVSTPGAILTDDIINGIDGAVALHQSKVILLVRHNTCGVGKMAAREVPPQSKNAELLVNEFRSYRKQIHELIKQPEVKRRVENGGTWLVLAEANTQTGKLSNFHRVLPDNGDGIIFQEIRITDIDMILCDATATPPGFVIKGCDTV